MTIMFALFYQLMPSSHRNHFQTGYMAIGLLIISQRCVFQNEEKSETDVHYSFLFGFQKSDDVMYSEMEICGTPLVAPGKKSAKLADIIHCRLST